MRQLGQIVTFAQNNDYQIPAQFHYIIEKASGRTLRREGLDRLRNAAASGQFNLLLCLAPDRLARNLGVQQLLLSELSHFGVEVIFTTQPMRGETPNDQLLLNIQGAFAEYERAVISDRLFLSLTSCLIINRLVSSLSSRLCLLLLCRH